MIAADSRSPAGTSRESVCGNWGWSEQAVAHLLTVYGHIDVIALEEVDRLYEGEVVPLHAVSDALSDAKAAESGS